MLSLPLRLRIRTPWRAIALATLSCFGCGGSLPAPIQDLVRQVLPTPDGVVIVFTPSTCALKSSTFEALSRLDRVAGASVIGIVTRLDEPSDSLLAVAKEFGAEFPLSLDADDKWTSGIAASHLPEPLLIVVRHGVIVAYLGGELLRDWRGEIPGFRGRTLGGKGEGQ